MGPFTRVHSPFQSEFSIKCDLVLSLSISSIPFSLKSSSGCANVFFLVFSSLLSFLLSFLQKGVSEDISYARCDQTSQPSYWLNVEYSCPRLSVILHFSHDPSSWSSLSFSSTKFQNFSGISDILSKCPCFNTMQSCSPDLSPIFW